MQYIAGFFKNTYEKCFNVSSLRIEKDPIYTSSGGPVRYILQGTYQEKQILLYICNPQPTIKQLLLVKHPGLLSIHLYKDNIQTVEVSGQKVSEALHLLHDILQAFEFLYGVLKLKIKSVDHSSFAFYSETQTYCFVDLASVCEGSGMTEQDLAAALFQLVCNQSHLEIPAPKKSFSKILKSSLFTDPSYQTYIEINKPGKLKDSLYLKELQALIERTKPEEIFQGLIDKLLIQQKNDKETLKFSYHLLIIAVNIVLKQKKNSALMQNQTFDETCQLICKSIKDDPQQFITHFLQLENLDKLQKQPAEYFTNVFVFFLEKRQQSSTQQQVQIYIMQLIQFASQNLAKASILFLQHCSNSIMQKLYNHFIYHIQFYSQDFKSLISWNLYLTISNLRDYRDENPSGTLGLSVSDFWKYKINEQCIKTLEQGTYDFIQALNLLNSAIPNSIQKFTDLKIPFIQLCYVIQNINSVKSLHQGILSSDPKRREVSRKLYEKCVRIGIDIQAKQEESNSVVQEDVQTKSSVLSKLGNFAMGSKDSEPQQNQETQSNSITFQSQQVDLNEQNYDKQVEETETSSTETSSSEPQPKKQNSQNSSKQQIQLTNLLINKKQPRSQQSAWNDFSDDSS